jgi:REP element-mobilizing transposase RayT
MARNATMTDPIAYLITFRTYGTWLHGDDRGSVDRKHNVYGAPMLDPHVGRRRSARQRLRHSPVTLATVQREAVSQAIREVCDRREWTLHAVNVRSNHVHVVVSAPQRPEDVMLAFKAWSTRQLRRLGLRDEQTRVWSRHGSTRYIWKPGQLAEACRYVVESQGEDDSSERGAP